MAFDFLSSGELWNDLLSMDAIFGDSISNPFSASTFLLFGEILTIWLFSSLPTFRFCAWFVSCSYSLILLSNFKLVILFENSISWFENSISWLCEGMVRDTRDVITDDSITLSFKFEVWLLFVNLEEDTLLRIKKCPYLARFSKYTYVWKQRRNCRKYPKGADKNVIVYIALYFTSQIIIWRCFTNI